MSNPIDIARLGHRYFPILKNASTSKESVISRVQNIEFTATHPTEKVYELGRVGPVGTTQEPTDFRMTLEENIHDEPEAELILAGKDPAVDTSYSANDIIGEADNEAYLLIRDTADVLTDEIHYTVMTVAEVNWRFAVGATCTTGITVEGTGGSWLTTPIHGAQTLDSDSIAGAKGKEARIWFGTAGSAPTATSRAYRLQSFNIRAAFPLQTVRELGLRNIVGKLAEPVDATIDFDVAAADEQPIDKFYGAVGGGYDLSDTEAQHVFVRLYDPDAAEATTVLRAWKIENCRPTGSTPTRAQVRGLSTMRYTLTSEKETTADSGGVLVYKGDIPA